MFDNGGSGALAFIIMLLFIGLPLFIFWLVQFGNLMGRSDDSFPGRYDKLIWGTALIFLGVLGAVAYVIARPRDVKVDEDEPFDCPKCGTTIPETEVTCPKCGWTFADELEADL